jgi:hypothetical protein
MPKKPRTKRPEVLNRTVDIVSFVTSLRVKVDEPKDPSPDRIMQWLELRGVLDEPVRRTSDVVLSLYPDARTKVGAARPPSVGAIIGARSTVEAVTSLPYAEFDRLWSFALSGHLKHSWIAFTKPSYNRGLVLAVSFSSEREE